MFRVLFLRNPDPVFYNELDIRLQQTLSETGMVVKEVHIDSIHIEFTSGNINFFAGGQLLEFDGFLSWGYMSPKHMSDYNHLVAAMEQAGKVTLHTSQADLILQNKMLQGFKFAKSNVPIPTSVVGMAVPSIKIAVHKNFQVEEPGVVKMLDGYGGDGVQLAKGQEEIVSLSCKNLWKGSHTVMQRFVPDSVGKSIRALCMDGKMVAVAQYTDQGSDFRSNNSYNDMFKLISLMNQRDRYEKVALEAIKSIDPELSVGGVDILDSQSLGLLVLEVNGWPDLYDTERSTGVNTFKCLAESFLHRLQRHYKKE